MVLGRRRRDVAAAAMVAVMVLAGGCAENRPQRAEPEPAAAPNSTPAPVVTTTPTPGPEQRTPGRSALPASFSRLASGP